MLARLSCCGGIFGADDWTMVLTMVYMALPLARTELSSYWKLAGFTHSPFSTIGRLYGSLCSWLNAPALG